MTSKAAYGPEVDQATDPQEAWLQVITHRPDRRALNPRGDLEMIRDTEKLHRCTTCGGIAEWHYILSRKDGSTALIPATRLAAGTRAFSPGQGTIGNEPHPIQPDYASPLTQADLNAAHARRTSAA